MDDTNSSSSANSSSNNHLAQQQPNVESSVDKLENTSIEELTNGESTMRANTNGSTDAAVSATPTTDSMSASTNKQTLYKSNLFQQIRVNSIDEFLACYFVAHKMLIIIVH